MFFQPLGQEGPDIRKPSAFSSSGACNGGDARDKLGGGAGCGQPSTLHTAMHTGDVAYQVGEEQPK